MKYMDIVVLMIKAYLEQSNRSRTHYDINLKSVHPVQDICSARNDYSEGWRCECPMCTVLIRNMHIKIGFG